MISLLLGLLLAMIDVLGYIYMRMLGMPSSGKGLIPFYWLWWIIKQAR